MLKRDCIRLAKLLNGSFLVMTDTPNEPGPGMTDEDLNRIQEWQKREGWRMIHSAGFDEPECDMGKAMQMVLAQK